MVRLIDRLEQGTASIAILGLGYVGLPLAIAAARSGLLVLGFDTDPRRRAQIKSYKSPFADIADEEIQAVMERGTLTIADDDACLSDADVIVICVPTPLLDGAPDMSHIESAAWTIAARIRPEQLIILESTTYPGTTEEFLRAILEKSGLEAGVDFFLGFSPERIDPANRTFGLANVPKLVGGIDLRSTRLMEIFYGFFVSEVVAVSSPKAAEMAKLLENTYRHVNIALINELAILCHDLGVDVWEVVDAASTKPFGFEPFYPGPGWGGHCIPVDPAYLSWRVRQMGATAQFVDLAREFNERMPGYVSERVVEELSKRGTPLNGATALILGVAYKPDVSDARQTSAVGLISGLSNAGIKVLFNDPYVPSLCVNGSVLASQRLTRELLAMVDIAVLHTGHGVYDREWLASSCELIFDTRNYFKGVSGPIVKL